MSQPKVSDERRYMLWFDTAAARDEGVTAIEGDSNLLLCAACDSYCQPQPTCGACGAPLEGYVPEKGEAPVDVDELAARIIGSLGS